MFKRILVTLDGSPLAELAIAHAELIARIFRSNIILLQVLEPASSHEGSAAVEPLSWQIRKAEADMYLQEVALRIRKNLGETESKKKSRVGYAIREGRIAENIVNFAHSENMDLLVISSHGTGGLSRWNISSITHKVINLIYLPVLIVRAYDQPMTYKKIDGYRRILLPIDGSRRAELALSAGIELARGTTPAGKTPDKSGKQSKLVLAAVIRPPELPIPEPCQVEISQLVEELLKISRLAVTNYLDETKGRLPVACETHVIENTSVFTAILELADQENIDLVVFCAHGYSGQVFCPYGSVSRNYIEYGTKPVLIIQDLQRFQVRTTTAEIGAEKFGRR